MEKITLYEEFRLIERTENEVSLAWKGAHLLLFSLAFVFGSFCTFCFHMLMYLFDGKCVLYPKLLLLNSLRHVAYDFIPLYTEKDKNKFALPLDFLSTHFAHKSVCYLPTYVPLASGIFGLVWTTMFLMCSSGSRSLSDLQRPWRVIPPVLVFSVAMSILSVYSSVVTYQGLEELCVKLGNITGNSASAYTVNLATLPYERQIRGVYQATRLTITSAWIHTACWIASALVAIARILLAIDFRLVKIRAELIGDIDRMLELNEQHLQTVLPTRWPEDDSNFSHSLVYSHFKNENYEKAQEFGQVIDVGSDILFISEHPDTQSDQALLPEEKDKWTMVNIYDSVRKQHRFIVNWLYDLLNSLEIDSSNTSDSLTDSTPSSMVMITRQFGQQAISSKTRPADHWKSKSKSRHDAKIKKDDEVFMDLKKLVQRELQAPERPPQHSKYDTNPTPSTSKKRGGLGFESVLSLTPEMQKSIEARSRKAKAADKSKPVVKDAAMQTERKINPKKTQKVTIADSKDTEESRDSEDTEPEISPDAKKDENTQTNRKEKQD